MQKLASGPATALIEYLTVLLKYLAVDLFDFIQWHGAYLANPWEGLHAACIWALPVYS